MKGETQMLPQDCDLAVLHAVNDAFPQGMLLHRPPLMEPQNEQLRYQPMSFEVFRGTMWTMIESLYIES